MAMSSFVHHTTLVLWALALSTHGAVDRNGAFIGYKEKKSAGVSLGFKRFVITTQFGEVQYLDTDVHACMCASNSGCALVAE